MAAAAIAAAPSGGPEGEMLILVLSAEKDAWVSALGALGASEDASGAQRLGLLFQAIAGFAASHVAFSPANRIGVVGFGSGWSEQLLPAPGEALSSAQGAALPHAAVAGFCRRRLGIEVVGAADAGADASSTGSTPGQVEELGEQGAPVAAGAGTSRSGLPSALSRAALVCMRHRREVPGASRRILVVAPGAGTEGAYVPLLNCAFAARDAGVTIDVVTAAPAEETVFLQQVAHETKGAFAPLTRISVKSPLQHLFLCAGPSASARDVLAPPLQKGVDLRASCMLTGERLSLAFVCFVCLSVFRDRHDECPICHTKAPEASAAKRPKLEPKA